MRSQTAQETKRTLYRNYFSVQGVLKRVQCDQSGNFDISRTISLFRVPASLIGCKMSRKTTYHPVANGGVEKNNRSIIAGLKNYVQRDPQSWDKFVAAMCSAHNASCHENTGVLPHFLLTGRNLR